MLSFSEVVTAFDTPTPMIEEAPSAVVLPPRKRHSRQYLQYFKPADTPMEVRFPDFSYPESKSEAGKHFWHTLHNIAATYPEKPSSSKKVATRVMLKQLIKSFPCENCKEHSLAYLKENPPNLRNKKAFSRYICEFHNTVNRHLGKPLYRCDVLSTETNNEDCDTCKVLPHSKNIDYDEEDEDEELMPEEPEVALIDDPDKFEPKLEKGLVASDTHIHVDEEEDIPAGEEVAHHFQHIRDSSKAIIEELCQKANIPAPEIVFGACPNHVDNSCTQAILGDEPKGRVYLNPQEYSPRSILHEFRHWFNAVKKNDVEKFKDENDAEVFARDTIKKFFPKDDVYNLPLLDATKVVEAQDKKREKEKEKEKEKPKHHYYEIPKVDFTRERLKRYLDPSHKWEFEKVGEKTEEGEKPLFKFELPELKQFTAHQRGGGLSDWFDGLYGPFAQHTGIPVQVLNDANTPEILGYSANAVQNMLLTPFGFILSSILTGFSLYTYGVMSDDMPQRDRRLLFETGSHMFWSFIPLAATNTPLAQSVFTGATAFGEALAKFDLNAIVAALKR